MFPILPALLLVIVQGHFGLDRTMSSAQLNEMLSILCQTRAQNGEVVFDTDCSNDGPLNESARTAVVTKLLLKWLEIEPSQEEHWSPCKQELPPIHFDGHPPLIGPKVAAKIHPNRAGPL